MDYRKLAAGIEYISDKLLARWARRYTNMLASRGDFAQRADVEYLLKAIGNELERRSKSS